MLPANRPGAPGAPDAVGRIHARRYAVTMSPLSGLHFPRHILLEMTTISLPTGHAVIAAVAISRGLWLVPVMISLGPFYMGWAFLACNSVQHIGMHHGDETGATHTPPPCPIDVTTSSDTPAVTLIGNEQ